MDEIIYSLSYFKKYDWLTTGYLLIWIVLILVNFDSVPSPWPFLSLHLLMFSMVVFLSGYRSQVPVLRLIQSWYQFFFLLLFFTALHYLIPAINPNTLDFQLINFDLFITGRIPTVWMEKFYSPLLTEILQLSYMAFYFLPLMILIPLYYRKEMFRFNRFGFNILLTFYLSYFGYLIFPALGPRYFLVHEQQIILDGLGAYHTISTALNGLENIQWDAFPSGHVAVAMIFSSFACRYFKKLFYITLPIVFFLILSTIYLRYHYLVDVLAGIFLFVVILVVDAIIFSGSPDSKFNNLS
ncbi:MAG: phosphatase PAP2 family protein [Calditrichaeota bacterium]|nr:phosphatase PAP2 family protein [Calditrichota bacterium]